MVATWQVVARAQLGLIGFIPAFAQLWQSPKKEGLNDENVIEQL